MRKRVRLALTDVTVGTENARRAALWYVPEWCQCSLVCTLNGAM